MRDCVSHNGVGKRSGEQESDTNEVIIYRRKNNDVDKRKLKKKKEEREKERKIYI